MSKLPVTLPSCTRSPILSSSTLARVIMSPASPESISLFSPPCDFKMWPGRIPFFSSLRNRLVSGLIVPLKMRMVEYFIFERGSKPTRNTSPASGPAGSALSSVTLSPSLSRRGFAWGGDGVYFTMMSRRLFTPISLRALVKTTGIIVPIFRAFTNTTAIFSAAISSPPR
ncbi:hypothetical protein ES703_119104 [subsurface metagenome]